MRTVKLVGLFIAFALLITGNSTIVAYAPEGLHVTESGTAENPCVSGSPKYGNATIIHPLQGVRIERQEELTGQEKDAVASKVLQTPDVLNVLGTSHTTPEPTMVVAVRHILDNGNTLLAVTIPTKEENGQSLLIYYEMAKPLVETLEQGYRIYKSQAMFVKIEGEVIDLISTSINGHLLKANPFPKSSCGNCTAIDPSSCGNCTDPFEWNYYGGYCTQYDGACIFRCCGACVVPCATQNWSACIACGVLWCPLCAFSCCTQTAYDCISCGTMP